MNTQTEKWYLDLFLGFDRWIELEQTHLRQYLFDNKPIFASFC